MDEVTIYTDGACSGNPGKGGWGAILIYAKEKKYMSGSKQLTTNNQMELMAAIKALIPIEYLKRLEFHNSVKDFEDYCI
jgi:ribonuclease HI